MSDPVNMIPCRVYAMQRAHRILPGAKMAGATSGAAIERLIRTPIPARVDRAIVAAPLTWRGPRWNRMQPGKKFRRRAAFFEPKA